MEEFIKYMMAIIALTTLTSMWMWMQLIARKMKVKNHIESTGGCCGACENRKTCDANSI